MSPFELETIKTACALVELAAAGPCFVISIVAEPYQHRTAFTAIRLVTSTDLTYRSKRASVENSSVRARGDSDERIRRSPLTSRKCEHECHLERLWRTSGIQFIALCIVAYIVYGYQPRVASFVRRAGRVLPRP